MNDQLAKNKSLNAAFVRGVLLNESEANVLSNLIIWQNEFSVPILLNAIGEEGSIWKRRAVLIALNFLVARAMPERKRLRNSLTLSWIRRKEQQSLDRSRRNFVRRIHVKNPLFAIQEIGIRYPGYTQQQLDVDLRRGKLKPKRKRVKSRWDLRRRQLEKLSQKLQYTDLNEQSYHQVCNRIVLLQQAHDLRLDIPIPVKLGGETEVYFFPWKTREDVIKGFVKQANAPGMSHEILEEKRKEILSSFYSY